MKKTNLLLIAFSAATILVSCKSGDKSPSFTELTKSYFDAKNELSPLDATFAGQNQYNNQLQLEMTDEFRAKQKAFIEKYESALTSIDESKLNEEEKISYEIIKWELSIGHDLLKYPTNLAPIQQFSGTQILMGQFASGSSAQPFKTEKDYTNFLQRTERFAVWMDSAMVYMRKGIKQKVVLPKALAVKLAPQFEALITAKAEDNLFYSAIKTMPSSFPEATKKKLSDEYIAVINNELMPRFKKMTQFLKEEYVPASRNTSGIGAFPFGKDLYAVCVKASTTTNKTPDQIHQLGLQEVARIKAEMQKVQQEVGFKGTMKEFCDYVRNKKELKPFTKPEQVIANFEKIYKTIQPEVNKLFSLQPKTPFEIKRTEAFREKTASAEYNQGTADGTRPGIFYVPIPDVKNYNYFSDEALFLHEAIPGHHFQISLQQENKSLPDFRKFNWFNAYGEGWALYTESLGKELGLYKDPYQYFGMLSMEMHRAIRLVVDTGIHSKGWTREQAIAYSLENEAEGEASIISEIERYMAVPAQALGYKIGQLKILELRHKAETQMATQFDIRKFHEKVLESGVLPLDLLEKKIDAWINAK